MITRNTRMETVQVTLTCPMCDTCMKLECSVDAMNQAIANVFCHRELVERDYGYNNAVIDNGQAHLPCCCRKRH